ncbi:MAG: GNAT family N-acetyltransferase [Bdellovibrionales bacterium]|nr:GNAT family N-acetyltransferase [Bdellovibrionales bacterium]
MQSFSSTTETEIQFVNLTTEQDWTDAFQCLSQLRPELKLPDFLRMREDLLSRNYKLLGLKDKNQIVCVAGYMLHPHIERGSEFWIHDLVSLNTERSKGYGLKMMAELEKIARHSGCKRVQVHTRIDRELAQNFYENKAKFDKYAYVYSRRI